MKNFKSLLILCSLLPVVYSCTSEDSYIDFLSSTYTTDMAFEQAKNTIFAMGLDTTDIVEKGGYYVVENDILINKDSCLYYSPKTRQYRTTYYALSGDTITIGVDNSITVSSGWIEALKEVINIYNEYTGLYFFYAAEGSIPTILISKKDLSSTSGNTVCAQGEFPFPSRRPGANVYINTGFFRDIDSFLTHNQKVFLLMHEIGHNLGLRHTDCAVNGEGVGSVGMINIPGTSPKTDDESYMNSGTCGVSWTGMPQNDAIALKYLWPFRIYTVSFHGCNLEEISFNSKYGYILDRTLIPKSHTSGKRFAGWYLDSELSNPYDYTKLKRTVVLYPKWTDYSHVMISTDSDYKGMPISFNISETTEVFFECTLYRGSNDWLSLYNVSNENRPVAVLYAYGAGNINQVLRMKQYIPVGSQQTMVSASIRIVLSKGKYYLHTTFPEIGGGTTSATVYY